MDGGIIDPKKAKEFWDTLDDPKLDAAKWVNNPSKKPSEINRINFSEKRKESKMTLEQFITAHLTRINRMGHEVEFEYDGDNYEEHFVLDPMEAVRSAIARIERMEHER